MNHVRRTCCSVVQVTRCPNGHSGMAVQACCSLLMMAVWPMLRDRFAVHTCSSTTPMVSRRRERWSAWLIGSCSPVATGR